MMSRWSSRCARGDAFHTFDFIRDDRRLPADQIKDVCVYYILPNEKGPRHLLPHRYLAQGGKIPFATYFASAGPGHRGMRFQPVRVNDQSPEGIDIPTIDWQGI